MTCSVDGFRKLFGAFPAAVSIVTTVDGDGIPHGFTCNTLCAVSLQPPLVSICVARGSRTLSALMSSRVFVANVLADGGQEVARLFASRSDGKFTAVRWAPSALAGGAPLLADVAVGYAECRVVQCLEVGDHWMVIGRVAGSGVARRAPLLYQGGLFTVWERNGTFLHTST